MKEKDVTELVERYKQMLASGKSIYFDAEDFDRLVEYYDSIDEMDEAEALINTGLEIHPDNQQLMLKKAKFMIYDGLYNKALEYLKSLFTEYDLDFYLLKIECLLQLNLYAEACVLTSEAIEKEENDLDILYSELGFVYAGTEHFDDAIMYLEKSLIYKNSEEFLLDIYTELSYAYEMKSDFASAIRISNKILDNNPYSYEMWINLGKLYSLQEEYENAIDAFDFAATIADDDSDVLKLKAHCLSLCGRTEEAISIFTNSLEEYPDDESLYYSLSECYFSVEQYDKMLYYLGKYEDIKGEDIEIIAKKAVAYLQKDDMDQALALIVRGLDMDGDNEDINIVAGELYFQSDNYILAENYFLKAYLKNKKNKTLLDRLSVICIAKDDIEKAIVYLERLILIHPDFQTKIRLSLMYFEIGNKSKFNQQLNSFTEEELKTLALLFFTEEQISQPSSVGREALIARLNEARECRQLFKNIKY